MVLLSLPRYYFLQLTPHIFIKSPANFPQETRKIIKPHANRFWPTMPLSLSFNWERGCSQGRCEFPKPSAPPQSIFRYRRGNLHSLSTTIQLTNPRYLSMTYSLIPFFRPPVPRSQYLLPWEAQSPNHSPCGPFRSQSEKLKERIKVCLRKTLPEDQRGALGGGGL